ncbi:NAD(+) diphosphatase [Tropicimonas isoalkanivorans]|uniref:NAD(+) diphosphatase n=1 Tax=Tropicimonas isoalkanivorans TaxID=441112 RepID=A0A1I1R074_9RHOB|nr:NAD(+) diphosphatase [Tropicimonas isoalkanivorans]SFD24943.1 NAD+ diphosphatase [Tropicimonas isoalkanivorans]
MRLAETVTFGGGGLDRSAALRADAAELERMLHDPTTRLLPIWRSKPMVRGDGVLSLASVPRGSNLLASRKEAPIFLGRSEESAWFALDVSGWEPDGQDVSTVGAFADHSEQTHPEFPEDHRFADLKMVMTRLAPRDAELAATARGLLAWHGAHRFCARCGAESLPAQAGWQRNCPACGAFHFPRTDPVVIMLVTCGNSVLLGRSPGWPDGMYSLLAGFIEPGETVEAAVRREVFEETGVAVGDVTYLASQPWPFPASLMIGCKASALSAEIRLDPEEIEDARWISREEVLAIFAGRHPEIRGAREGAIAHFLLSHWLADRLD